MRTPDDPASDVGGASQRWPVVAVDPETWGLLEGQSAAAAVDLVVEPAEPGAPVELAGHVGIPTAVPLVDLRSGRTTGGPDGLADLAVGVLGLPDPPVAVVLTDDPVHARAALDLLEVLRFHRRARTGDRREPTVDPAAPGAPT